MVFSKSTVTNSWEQHAFAQEAILTSEKTDAGRQHKWHPGLAEEKLPETTKRLAQGKPPPVHNTAHHEAFTAPPPVVDFIYSKCLDSEISHKDKFHRVEPHDSEAHKASRVSAYRSHFADRPKLPARSLREKNIETMRNATVMHHDDVSSLDARKRPPFQRHGEVGHSFGQGKWHLAKKGLMPKAPDASKLEAGGTVIHQQDRFHPKAISREGVKEIHIDRQTGRPMWPLSAREIQPYATEHQANFTPRQGHAQTKEFFKYKRGLKDTQDGVRRQDFHSAYNDPARATVH
eukprot:gnl/MRDRNA2_/MRDRNA2_100671_c0_seq1.p1 gnl/MRDRNA2_/MRDRNA2_100671_c0~~gnl/MRDRNA2_/MRDRNA2_100671_c0_seq1.p1  ORF type:complete len:290 (+),score=50.09 gnl/MRDRNA2_/MRDRNA2_100671_c0_seq1:78-947(+)